MVSHEVAQFIALSLACGALICVIVAYWMHCDIVKRQKQLK